MNWNELQPQLEDILIELHIKKNIQFTLTPKHWLIRKRSKVFNIEFLIIKLILFFPNLINRFSK